MLQLLLRRLAAALLAAAVVLSFGASVANADLPPAVRKNMRAITELQYKYFDPNHYADYVYPTCHRTCELLFRSFAREDRPFTHFDELYLLAARTGLTANFDNEPYSLGAASTIAEVVHGSLPSVNGPMRFAGLQIPGISGVAQFSDAQLWYPGHTVAGFWFDGQSTQLHTPDVGWVGNAGVRQSCDPVNTQEPDAGPGEGWELITQEVGHYFCAVWNQAEMRWDTSPGEARIWAWWHPAKFYGPSKRDSWVDVTNSQQMGLGSNDPGFSVARGRTDDQLTNGTDYDDLIAWLNTALGGGAWSPTPRDLDGDGNPAAPNLKHTYCGDPVNCATGNFTETYDDTTVRGPGVTLSQERSYNSQQAVAAQAAGPFGRGWSATFRAKLDISADGAEITVHNENGSQARFSQGLDGNYVGDEFVQATLARLSNGHFQYTLPDQTVFEFDADGRLLSEADLAGNRTTLAYDGDDVSTVTDATGRHLTYTYNSDGTVATVTDPGGHVVHYGYDGGDLTSVTDVGGGVTHFAYDANHQITAVTDPRGHVVTRNTYDDQNRVVRQRDALDHETTWAYGTDEATITDPSGSVTHEEFEDLLPTTITKAVGTASQATTHFAYDDAYNLVRKIDEDGKTWNYAYDLRGNLIGTTDPLGHATTYTYDNRHHVTQVVKPGGLTTLLRYTPAGQLESTEVQGIDYRHMYQYGDHGLVSAAYEGNCCGGGRWTNYTYDPHGNVASVESGAHRTTTATYDASGFPLTTRTARGKITTITRDAYEQPLTVVDARGKTTTYAYDANENPTSVTDRNGHTETTVFDELDRPIEDHRADGSIWRTTYDTAGAVATRTDGRGKTTSYTYDHQHRLHTKTDPRNRETVYDYDGAGDLTSAVLPDGTSRALSYDDAGQLTGIDYSGGSDEDVTFAYDVDGHRTSMTDGAGTTSYTYDIGGRLTSQTSAAGQKTTYHYDALNRVASIDYPDALSVVTTGGSPQHVSTGTVTRTYDADDNLTAVSDWLGNTTRFAYDGDDNLTGITRPNGVNATYDYDDVEALTSITDDTPPTSLARDDERQLSGTDDGTSPASFSYDDGDRLVGGLGRTYAYDDADDLIQTATAAGAPVDQHFNDAGELTSRTAAGGIPVATLTYDDNGQRTGMTPAAGGTATSYDWTHAGRLASYSGPGAGGATATESYTYDGDGLRQTVTTGDQRRHEAWDISGSAPLMITDGPTSYVTGPGGLPVEQIGADGTVRYFSHDQLGSTTALTNGSGTTVQRYSYDAYGQLTSPAPTVENPFQFAGQFTDATTGLQYLRARYYDPSTGQFISRDPLEGDTLEPYTYADGNPINNVDPEGTFSVGDLWASGKEAASRGFEGALGEADGISSVLSFGHLKVSSVLGIDTDCLGPSYRIGKPFGDAVGLLLPVDRAVRAARFLKNGWEIKIGEDVRIAPGGNRTGHPTGRFPHYHRRVVDPETGVPVPGQGIKRHRPWDTKSTDTSFWNRF